MIERIVLEPAEDRISPAPKVLVLASVSDVIFVSVEKQDETNNACTTRVIEESPDIDAKDLTSIKAEIAVDAGDLEDAVKLLRRREKRFEKRLETEKADEDRRKIERPWRDLESAVEKANYRAGKLHEQLQDEILKSEELAREVTELQESLNARRAAVEAELPKEAAAEQKAAIKAEEQSEASS